MIGDAVLDGPLDAAGVDRLAPCGLAGVGDLILTCTGDQSRNRTLGKGETREGDLEHAIDVMVEPLRASVTPSSAIQPAWADSPESCAMPTGPDSCLIDVWPLKRPPKVWKINVDHSMFWLTLISTDLTAPGAGTRTGTITVKSDNPVTDLCTITLPATGLPANKTVLTLDRLSSAVRERRKA